MPESLVPVPQWKKDRCEFCKAGWDRGGGTHFPTALGVDPIMNCKPCTAPTEREYIEELEARLKESAEDTARYRLAIGEIAWSSITESHQESEIYHICYKAITQFKGDGLQQETVMRAAIEAARGVKP